MPRISKPNFYLKEPDSKGLSLIYLQFSYTAGNKKQKLFFSFGQKIERGKLLKDGTFENWDTKRMRVKSNKRTIADGSEHLNDLLSKLENECIRGYNTELKNGIPSPHTIRKYLEDVINPPVETEQGNKFYQLIERFVRGEINEKSDSTLKGYKTTYNLLKQFEKDEQYPINFESINLDFYYRFTNYLRKPHKVTIRREIKTRTGKKTVETTKTSKLQPNSIGSRIKHIRVFMNEAVDLGYTQNTIFKHRKFKVDSKPADSVALADDDILKLYSHEFTNPRLEKVRDLFVFGCCTGLRFSDYSTVSPDNIIDEDGERMIKIKTKKVDAEVIIPCNPIAEQILYKYGGRPPAAISDQRFNDYIKEACKEAGLNQKGRLASEPSRELWECVSSHTARRSFITQLYLEDFPIYQLMKISGHSTIKNLQTYIKVDNLKAARDLRSHNRKKDWTKWSKFMLKVA